VVAVLAGVADIRGAIGFSSFAVLVYYAIANASAFTLRPAEGAPARLIPVCGLLGCVLLAGALPLPSMLAGTAVLLAGAIVYCVRARVR
jgi:APA family basic amino acid/polyamine antiporter